jgi:hypothetical protein
VTGEDVVARARAHVVAERERGVAAREVEPRAREAGVRVEEWPAYVGATLDRMLEGLADPPARLSDAARRARARRAPGVYTALDGPLLAPRLRVFVVLRRAGRYRRVW